MLKPNAGIGSLKAVLYSVEQDAFHLETINEYLDINVRNAILRRNKNDYKLVGIFNTDIEADKYIETFRKHLKVKF